MGIFTISDYRLKSTGIIRNTIWAITLLFGLLLVGEWLVDFKKTSAEVLIPFFTLNLLLLGGFYLKKEWVWIPHIQLLLALGLLQTNLILWPDSFHIIVYWFPFMPLFAIVAAGMRASLYWFLITFSVVLLNSVLLSELNGVEYQTGISYVRHVVAGLIFLFGIFISTALLYRLMGEAYMQMRESREELLKKNDEVANLNEKLSVINASLDETVKARTMELQKQNEHLAEYAFINSHMLRAPLSKILGSSLLLSTEGDDPIDPKLLDTLIASSRELDGIIHRIDKLLQEGHFDRNDIDQLLSGDVKE